MAITSSLSNPLQWLIDWVCGPDAAAGVKVTIDTALGDASVWNAVQKISGHIGLMPLNLRRSGRQASEVLDGDPLHFLTTKEPNEMQTPFVFKQLLMLHALLAGNGRAAIVRKGDAAVELIPMLPSQTITCLIDGKKWHVVTPMYSDDQLEPYYRRFDYNDGDGRGILRIPDKDVLHIPGLSYNGFVGISIVDVLRDALGIGLAAQKAVGATFRSPKPGVMIHAPVGTFRDDQDAQDFISNFNKFHEGVDNAGRAGLLKDGMTTSVLPVNAADQEWLEQRRFQRQDVAMIFGLESVLGDGESVSYNSLEQRNLAYLTNCLLPWATKIEQECSKKLLGRNRRNKDFYKFDQTVLLRMDMSTTFEAYSKAITGRIMNPNEVRERIDLPPYEGGDEFANPAISPGKPGVEDDEAEPQQESETSTDDIPEPDAPANISRRVVNAQVHHLVGVECQRVAKAATGRKQHLDGQKNFIAWQDSFYQRWQKTLASTIAKFGGGQEIASTHCDESQRQLLELAGSITDPKTWAAAVADLTDNWGDRAETITDAIMEAIND